MVKVTWRDAHFEFEQPDVDAEDYLVTTLGFLLEAGPRFLKIAAEQTPDGPRAITYIPVESVIATEHLDAITPTEDLSGTPTVSAPSG